MRRETKMNYFYTTHCTKKHLNTKSQCFQLEKKKKRSQIEISTNLTQNLNVNVITRPGRERTRGELGNAGRYESQSELALGRALACLPV